MTGLVAITTAALALAAVAHVCRRAEHRRRARLVGMRWDEIARHDQSRTRAHRTVAVVRRSVSRTRDALFLVALCFGVAAVYLVIQG